MVLADATKTAGISCPPEILPVAVLWDEGQPSRKTVLCKDDTDDRQ